MENMVDNVVETPVADTQEDVVSVADLMDPVSEETQGETQAETLEPQADAAQRTYTKQEFDDEVRRRAAYIKKGTEEQYRRELEADPYYNMGRKFAAAEAAKAGKKPYEVLPDVEKNFMERQAKELAENPEALAMSFLNAQVPRPAPDIGRQTAAGIARDLGNLMDAGVLPRNFDLQQVVAANPGFLQDCAQFGVGATIGRMQQAYQEQQQVAARNNSLPQSTRPGHNEQSGRIDYSNMSSDEFAKVQERIRQAHLAGKKVRL